MFVDGPGICAIVPYIRKGLLNYANWFCIRNTRARARGNSLALRRRVKERSESEDAGLGACLFKEAVEEGRLPTEHEGTCETRPRGTKNEDG